MCLRRPASQMRVAHQIVTALQQGPCQESESFKIKVLGIFLSFLKAQMPHVYANCMQFLHKISACKISAQRLCCLQINCR
jgi:hypothetical protein